MRSLYHALKYFAVTLWSAFVIFPFIWILSTSFKTQNAVTGGATWLSWLHYEPSLAGWKALFGGPGGVSITKPYINSVILTGTASVIALTHGTLAADGFSRFTFRAGPIRNGNITFFFISPRIIPPVVLAIRFFLMLRWLGLLDSLPGLILVYVAAMMPIEVWLVVDFFNTIPRALDEMASMDGSTHVSTFFRVILPNVLPGLVVAGMFCLIFGLNDIFFAFTLTFTQTQLLTVSILAPNSSITPLVVTFRRRHRRGSTPCGACLLSGTLPVKRRPRRSGALVLSLFDLSLTQAAMPLLSAVSLDFKPA